MDYLVRFETFVREGFLKGEHVVFVFFDLEKAYDTTCKYVIMKGLHDMDLRGRLPLFIKNFYLKEISSQSRDIPLWLLWPRNGSSSG